MFFKKLVGVIEMLFGLVFILSCFFGAFWLKPKVTSLLVELSGSQISISDQGVARIWEIFIGSGYLSVAISVLSILIGFFGLLFLLQGIVNLLSDKPKEFSEKKEEHSELSTAYKF